MSNVPKPATVNSDIDPDTEERDDSIIGRALLWSSLVIAVLVPTGFGVAYWLQPAEKTQELKQTESPKPEIPAVPKLAIPQVPFADITSQAGIDFVHQNGANGEKLLPETMGGGCAFFDFDNDGDQDLLLINSANWNHSSSTDRPSSGQASSTHALYENDGHGHFRNVTVGSGLDVSFYGMGVAVGDYDNDGFIDVFISSLHSNHLYRNLSGSGKFEDVTTVAGVSGDENAWSTSCGWFDYDNDGRLDLFVCNYLVWSRDLDLSKNFKLTGGGRAYGRPQEFNGVYSFLYHNEGDGKFVDVAKEMGIQVDNPLNGQPMGKSLGVSFADFDNDGWIDFVVANDTVQNFFFHNQKGKRFVEKGGAVGIAFDGSGKATGAMGIDSARHRNSKSYAVAIGNFSNEATALYVSQGELLLFSDESLPTGLGPRTLMQLTFGVFFFDCDLDGRLDLFAANGHLEEDIHLVQSSQYYEQPPQLFWNCGPESRTEFVPLPDDNCGASFVKRIVGRGAAYADIDGDGDLDVLITASGQSPRLLRNEQKLDRHWLRFKLQGKSSNRSAIGALIKVETPDGTFERQVMPTRSYLSQVELPVTIGLGNSDVVKSVTIRWPNGPVQTLEDVQLDRVYEIEQATN